MKTQRRTNFLLGLIVLAVAIVIILRAFNLIPAGIDDLLNRSWPTLLVIGGLSVFLRERMRFGSLLALVAGLALVGGLTAASFSARSTQERDDYQESIAQPIGDGISLLRVEIKLLATRIELLRSLQSGQVAGQFVGSSESLLQSDYTEAGDGTAQLTITETRPNQFPLLEAVGRGSFRLEFPAGVPLDVSVIGAEGTVSLNMSGLSLERLNLDLFKGDAVVSLPEYKPLGSAPDAVLGALVARDGNMTVLVPPTIAARLELNRGGSGIEPQFDSTVYNPLVAGSDIALETRNFDTFDTKLKYVITIPRGLLTVQAAGSG